MVYAKNRASVTFGDKTWRTEYQARASGFRYADATIEWSGRDDLATLRETRDREAARLQLPAAATNGVDVT